MDQLKDIFDYVDAHQEEFLKELQDLCACRSVAGDTKGLDAARETVTRTMEQAGIPNRLVDTEDGNDMISGTCSGEKDYTVLFYNHYDVVEEGDHDKWKGGDPFKINREGDKMIARGVSDDKGPLMGRIQAIRSILAVKGKLPVNVRFLFEGDEETSSPSMFRYQRTHPEEFRNLTKADICFWENGRNDSEGRPWARFGVRGSCTFDLKVTTSNSDVHGRMGAIMPSASWRLVKALATLRTDDERVAIEGFYDDIEEFTEADRKVLENLPYDEEGLKNKYGFKEYLCGATGAELKRRVYYEPSMSICGLEAGEMYKGPRGIVPHTASARLSFYLIAQQDPKKLYEQLRSHFDRLGYTDIEIEPHGGNYPVRTSVDIKERAVLEKAALEVFGKPLVIEPFQLGGGPAIVMRRAWPGMPVVGIGPGNMSGNHHSPNENLFVKDYINAIKFTIAFLYEMAEIIEA